MAVTLESLKKTVGKKKTPSRAYAWLADLERASGDLDGALRRIDGGLGLYMNDLPGLLVRSRILFEKEQYEDCVAVCEMALKNDPFCLSAQKRMGDAFDKLGNEAERNKCYRRVHDMDPLDNFWKEEYDVVLGTAAAVEDSDFVMPGLSADDAETPATDDGGLTFLTSGEESSSLVKENSFNIEDTSDGDSGLFEKSLDSSADSGSSIFSKSAEESPKPSSSPFSSPFEEMSAAVPSIEESAPAAEDDPFAALSALLPSDDESDSASMDNLQASLDAAMSNLDSGEGEPLEDFPADDNISGGDVSNVLSDMFGDDNFEDSTESKSPFSNLNIPKDVAPDSFNARDVDANSISITNDSNMFGLMEKIGSAKEETPAAPAEDQPMSVDTAFASIFGEDELPEEKPITPPAEEVAPAAEVEPAAKPAPAEDQPMSVDSAFASIFGEDELPEEKTEESSSEGFSLAGLDAALASEDLSSPMDSAPSEESSLSTLEEALAARSGEPATEEPAFEESVIEKPAESEKAEQGGLSVDNAFASIFGEDELPEEKSESSAFSFDKTNEQPAADEFVVNPTEEPSAATEVEDSVQSVDNAFASIFGEDELSVEKNSTEDVSGIFNETPEARVVEPVEETLEIVEPADSKESLADRFEKAEDELKFPSANSEELESEIGGAFSSIFGEAEEVASQEATSAALEESVIPSGEEKSLESEIGGAFSSIFGEAEESSSQEATSAALEESVIPSGEEKSLESEIGGAFSSMFGEAEESSSQEATSAAIEESVIPSGVEKTLESEVSGAFKDLFHTDDDVVLESEEPSSKGVDFLMSGDSDDEVSVGLIKDPSQPLSKGDSDIDESLNTKTLAEIYFEQGLYGKALDIYQDLCNKEPSNVEYQQRLDEIEKIYRDKFGGN